MHFRCKVLGNATFGIPLRKEESVTRPKSKKSSRLGKEDLELLNQALNNVRELMKRWDERLTLGSLKMRERFEAGNFRILLSFGDVYSGKRWIISFEPIVPIESLTFTENVGANSYQSSVFVDVVRFVKFPKRSVSAFIRLESIDELHSAWFNDSLYFSTRKGFVTMERFANRERYLSQNCFARIGIGNQGEVVHHVIEGATKVLQNIASDREHIEMNDREISEDKIALGKFRILLGNSNLSVGIPICLRSRFEFSEVLLGPFNLYADRDKSFFGAQWHAKNDSTFGS